MRFAAFLEFEHDKTAVPPWYRIAFASLIKEAIKAGDSTGRLYQTYYGNSKSNIPKPFTFAVKLNVEQKKEREINKLQIGKYATLYVSSNAYDVIVAIYNGLRSIQRYNVYGNNFVINRFSMLTEKKCGSREVFSIFSPIVVRRVSDDRKGIGYTEVNSADYVRMLKFSIISQCKFLGDSYCIQPDDIEINTAAAFPVKIPHYNKKNPDKPEIITATDGAIEISAPKEVVQLLYDNGIGARRSQGFGMVEVVG